MSFLGTMNPARMLVRIGSSVHPLAPYQLKEILQYQDGKEFNRTWLCVDSDQPYFTMRNGVASEILYYTPGRFGDTLGIVACGNQKKHTAKNRRACADDTRIVA